jgi:predicted CopG family antitoxin
MSKRTTLSEEAYKLLTANRKHAKESLSLVIMRFVPRPIRTVRALEQRLNQVDDQLQVDFEELE